MEVLLMPFLWSHDEGIKSCLSGHEMWVSSSQDGVSNLSTIIRYHTAFDVVWIPQAALIIQDCSKPKTISWLFNDKKAAVTWNKTTYAIVSHARDSSNYQQIGEDFHLKSFPIALCSSFFFFKPCLFWFISSGMPKTSPHKHP